MIELAAPERREGERSEPSRSGGAANSTPPAALPVGTEVMAKAQRRKFTAEYKPAIISPTCYAAPGTPYIMGTAPRTIDSVRSDGVHNIDFSIFKNFRIRESMNAQFRVEAFNLLNSVQYGIPAAGWNPRDLSTFGRVTSASSSPGAGECASLSRTKWEYKYRAVFSKPMARAERGLRSPHPL